MSRFLLVAIFLFAIAPDARAEVANCTQITSLPTTITTQGTYCLKADLSTALATGAAITVATNNVILDCNQFKIGGLAAGVTTRTRGISAVNRNNLVVRNCNIRGFHFGVLVEGGAGHVIEDNRMDGNTYMAAAIISADGSLIRRNHVVDTGGNLPLDVFPFGVAYAVGVQGGIGGIVEDNSIVNVAATLASDRPAHAIAVFSTDAIVRRNGIISVIGDGTGAGHAIAFSGGGGIAVDNQLLNPAPATAYGVNATVHVICRGNTSKRFTQGVISPACVDGGGNVGN